MISVHHRYIGKTGGRTDGRTSYYGITHHPSPRWRDIPPGVCQLCSRTRSLISRGAGKKTYQVQGTRWRRFGCYVGCRD